MTDKRTDIFNAARELFFARGYKETNVPDIVNRVGIGVSTFYKCFSSKEEIFMEIYLKESEDYRKRLFESINLNDGPAVTITKLLTHSVSDMNSNPILMERSSKELFDRLYHCGIKDLIKKWKNEGKLRNDIDDEMIWALLKSIFSIEVHKSEIDPQYFSQVLSYIAESVIKGLTDYK